MVTAMAVEGRGSRRRRPGLTQHRKEKTRIWPVHFKSVLASVQANGSPFVCSEAGFLELLRESRPRRSDEGRVSGRIANEADH